MRKRLNKVWLFAAGMSIIAGIDEAHWIWISIIAILVLAEIIWGENFGSVPNALGWSSNAKTSPHRFINT